MPANDDFPRGFAVTKNWLTGNTSPFDLVIPACPAALGGPLSPLCSIVITDLFLNIWQASAATALYYGQIFIIDGVIGTLAAEFWEMGSGAAAGGFALCQTTAELSGKWVGSPNAIMTLEMQVQNGLDTNTVGTMIAKGYYI
jgi:hypothetical protein